MKIKQIHPRSQWILEITAEDGRVGLFDLTPYLPSEAFAELREEAAFQRVRSGGYFIEWECGADLSADTIEAHWRLITKQGQGFTKSQELNHANHDSA
jgi:hypothetical protein